MLLGLKDILALKSKRINKMVDFTKLVKRGHQSFIAKYRKKRQFGKCNSCEKPALLMEYIDPVDPEVNWNVCEYCFKDLQLNEE